MVLKISEITGAVAIATTLTLFPSIAQAQDDLPIAPRPNVPVTAASIQQFVPVGWKLERSARGDLNGDKLADIALVIRSQDDKLRMSDPNGFRPERYDTNPRTVMVALAQKGGGFRRVGISHTLIPRIGSLMIDDPFEEAPMEIKRGVLKLSIKFFASSGTWSMHTTDFTFRYQNGGVYLIGYDKDYVHRGSGEQIKTSANFLTGRVRIGTGSIEDNHVETTWKKIKGPLIKLEDVGDGWNFTPAPNSD